MPLLDVSGDLYAVFEQFSYLAPFTVLLLCGIGLPLPEEVTLIGAGFLLYKGYVDFTLISLTCGAAILIGDSLPFWLGHHFGMNALKIRWVARVLHPERFQRLQERFREHGNWATFACRFFAGVRIPGYFVAGTMGMSFPRFFLLDALGVLISVPTSIYLGKLFGGKLDELKNTVHDLHLILAFLVLVFALSWLLARRRGRVATSAGPSHNPLGSAASDSEDPPLNPS